MSVHGILHSQKVTVVCTTDDPVDSLGHHQKIARDGKLKTRIYPTFRPTRPSGSTSPPFSTDGPTNSAPPAIPIAPPSPHSSTL